MLEVMISCITNLLPQLVSDNFKICQFTDILTEIVLTRARFSDSPYERRFANNKLVLSVSRAEPSPVSPPTHPLM